MRLRSFVSTFCASAVLTACSHTPVITQNPTYKLPPKEYEQLFKARTRHADQYEGFYQTFQADVTILSTDLVGAGLDQRAQALRWPNETAAVERDRQLDEAKRVAKFFVRYYAPDRETDDLDKPKTIWRTYLEVNGQRYEGKAKRVIAKLIELQTLYPNFNRFSSPYEITFDVPMTTVERAEAKFTLTGNLGTAEFNFPPR